MGLSLTNLLFYEPFVALRAMKGILRQGFDYVPKHWNPTLSGLPSEALAKDGVTDGTRTRDSQNHNLELYQLSYGHQPRGGKHTEPAADVKSAE